VEMLQTGFVVIGIAQPHGNVLAACNRHDSFIAAESYLANLDSLLAMVVVKCHRIPVGTIEWLTIVGQPADVESPVGLVGARDDLHSIGGVISENAPDGLGPKSPAAPPRQPFAAPFVGE